jgi:hypothetical protein
MVKLTKSSDGFVIDGVNYYTMLLLQGLYVEQKYSTGDVVFGNGAYYSCQYGFMKDPVYSGQYIVAKQLFVRQSQMLVDYKQKVVATIGLI